MRILGEQTSRALRHRRGQAVALVLLAATVTALSVAAPLYSRAMGQALTTMEIQQAPRDATALQITSQPTGGTNFSISDQMGPVDPAQLAALVPAQIRRDYGAPELSRASHSDSTAIGVSGQLIWRPGQCAHLTIVQGHCPTKSTEIVVSHADLSRHGIRLGGTVEAAGVTVQDGQPASVKLHVVGVYQVRPGPFWQTRSPVGMSGTPATGGVNHDDWFTAESTFLDPAHPLPGLFSSVILPLNPDATSIDDVLALPGRISALSDSVQRGDLSGRVSITSNLSSLSDDVATQQTQANRTVPLLMLQVVLLALVVFWQILAAAADQRRPDVALARLRGLGARPTIRLLLRELLTVTEIGVVLGAIVGFGIAVAAERLFLPPAPIEFPAAYWLTVLACAVGVGLLTWLTARNLAHEPMDRLLRQVPARLGWHWSAFDTVLFTLAAAGVAAFAAGGLGKDFALAGPALIALLVGLILSHLLTPIATRTGRWALGKGRLVSGLAALEATRRPGARRMVTMLTLAAAFLVFFANAWAVGAANRERVAEQVVGAQQVLGVATTGLAPVQKALHTVDPDGAKATPVVLVNPLGDSTAPSTMAVVPDQFSRIALLDAGSRALPWNKLKPASTPPMRIHGTHIAIDADTSGLGRRSGTVHLGLQLLLADDVEVSTVSLGNVRGGRSTTTTLHTLVPCAQACTVLGLTVASAPGVPSTGTIRLGPVRGSGTTSWGGAGRWPDVRSDGSTIRAIPAAHDGLGVYFDTGGSNSLTLGTGWLPSSFPVIALGKLPDVSTGPPTLLGLDRLLHPIDVMAHAGPLAAAPASTLVVDLDTLARGVQIDPGDQFQIWLRGAAPAFVAHLTHALESQGVSVQASTSVSDQRQQYDASVAAWSLALALMIGVVTLLIALLAMIVLSVTSWRSTAHDLAALRMTGMSAAVLQRGTVLAQVLTVAVAVAIGAAAGVIASWLAIDQVPLFAHQPPLTVLDLSPSWVTILVTVVLTAVLLLGAAVVLARRVAARASLDRLRGES